MKTNTIGTRNIVRTHVAKNQAATYLEIGVREGNSLLEALKVETLRLAVGVDTWGPHYGGSNRGSADHLWSLIADPHRVLLISGDSKQVLPMLSHLFDVIYVDGDHSEAGCLADLDNSKRLLSSRGVIFVDDIFHPAHLYLHDAVCRWAELNAFQCDIYALDQAEYGLAQLQRA
jgi:spermidine synthase